MNETFACLKHGKASETKDVSNRADRVEVVDDPKSKREKVHLSHKP